MARKRADFGVAYPGAYYSAPYAPAVLQTKSLQFLAATDELGEASRDTVMGITSTWTFACWVKLQLDSTISARHVGGWRGLAFADTVQIRTTPTSVTDIQVIVTDAAQANRVDAVWSLIFEGAVSGAAWRHVVVTWDGTVSGMQCFLNGADEGASDLYITNLDDTGITDTDRDVRGRPQ